VGKLIQLDGSHHDWFEGRGPRCVLMAYIDDASSRVFARFSEYEGTIPAMASVRRYLTHDGMPRARDTDTPTTDKSSAAPTVEEPLTGRTLVHDPAGSPRERPAPGGHCDNRDVAVPPAQAADLHRPRPASRDLDRTLCLKTTRVVRRDWTVAHPGQLLQLETQLHAHQVRVENHLNGTMRITHRGQPLRSHTITSRPVRVMAPTPPATPKRPVKLAPPLFARPSPRCGDPDDVTRTFLLWEKEDISKLG
jgi:hypothetical protein